MLIPIFVELLGEYTDGENLDVLVNISDIYLVRPHPNGKPRNTMIHFRGDEIPGMMVLEPYEEVKRKILAAASDAAGASAEPALNGLEMRVARVAHPFKNYRLRTHDMDPVRTQPLDCVLIVFEAS